MFARVCAVLLVTVPVLLCLVGCAFLRYNRLVWRAHLSSGDWEADTEYLAYLIPRVHPNAFAHLSTREYQDEVMDAKSDIPSRTEAQIELSLVRLVASVQDGHSTLFPFQPATGFRMLPLQIYLFSDGWYVTDSSPTYGHLVGRRIMRIGSQNVDEAFAMIRPFIGADSEATIEDRAPLYLLCPEVLQALGISSSSDSVRFGLEDARGNVSNVEIKPVMLASYLYWYFAPLQQWKHKVPQGNLPLYRQAQWDNYWFRYLESSHTVYLAFNQVRDKSDETFEQFGQQVLNFCDVHNAERLVVDVRNNSGGDNTIFRGFIETLRNSRMNRRGSLYLVIGRHTFSAAVNFTSVMEAQTNAILVGEAAGAGPNHYGDSRKYVLCRIPGYGCLSLLATISGASLRICVEPMNLRSA